MIIFLINPIKNKSTKKTNMGKKDFELNNEKDLSTSLSESERKERYVQYLISMNELEYWQKYKCALDGKAKRRMRKEITAKVNKGYIRLPVDIDLNN